eukprot:RCo037469
MADCFHVSRTKNKDKCGTSLDATKTDYAGNLGALQLIGVRFLCYSWRTCSRSAEALIRGEASRGVKSLPRSGHDAENRRTTGPSGGDPCSGLFSDPSVRAEEGPTTGTGI